MTWRRHHRHQLESLDLDFEDHLARETAENLERGMPPDEAHYAALRAFGNRTYLREEARYVWIWRWLEELVQDLRYAQRILRRNPGFTATAVFTLALCIGMNTAMFSVVDAVILQPLPYPNPDRLVWISENCSANGFQSGDDCFMSRHDFITWKQQAQTLDRMALVGNQDIALVYRGEATTERVGSIEGDFWSILNARASLGHLFGASEHDAVVLSWPFFERTFNADRRVLGKAVDLEGHTFRIIGVLPPNFRNLVPQALYPGDEVREISAYIPTVDGIESTGYALRSTPQSGPTPSWFRIVGRIKPAIAFDQARAEMEALFSRSWKEHLRLWPGLADRSRLRFETLTQRLSGRARPTLTVLFAAVLFVLFIGIANIANLLLARASAREREIAIRAAVGAGRRRVIRQFLTETVLLSAIGGATGIVLASASLGIIKYIGSTSLPRLEEARISLPVILFCLSLSLAAGIVFGLVPVRTLLRRDLDQVLKHQAGGSFAQLRLRGVLVAIEVALTLVLLISAGLMLKSFRRMTFYPPGLRPDRILTMRVSLSGPRYDRQWPHQAAYLQELFRRVAKLPGIEAFGIDCGQLNQTFQVAGVRPYPGSEAAGTARYVSSGYLTALGMPLSVGRWPSQDELLDNAMVNNRFVRTVASGENVVGRQLKGTLISATILGVVADFKDFQLDIEPQPQVFTAYQSIPVLRQVRVALRTSGEPLFIAETIRRSIAGIDKNVPVFEIQTLQQELSSSVASRRFNLALLATFAATALFLATVGLYGVIAYLVAQRAPEIGIRIALGASRISILHMIVGQGMRMVLIGVAVGLPLSALLTQLLSGMLYGVTPGDIQTFLLVAAGIVITGLIALLGPGLRAISVDPVVSLRNE